MVSTTRNDGKVGTRELSDILSGDVEGTAVKRCVESLGDTAAICVRRQVFGSKLMASYVQSQPEANCV